MSFARLTAPDTFGELKTRNVVIIAESVLWLTAKVVDKNGIVTAPAEWYIDKGAILEWKVLTQSTCGQLVPVRT